MASVAQLVRALHRNRRAEDSIPARDLLYSCNFRTCSWLGLINVYKFPLDNFHLRYPSNVIHSSEIPTESRWSISDQFSKRGSQVKFVVNIFPITFLNLEAGTLRSNLYFVNLEIAQNNT